MKKLSVEEAIQIFKRKKLINLYKLHIKKLENKNKRVTTI